MNRDKQQGKAGQSFEVFLQEEERLEESTQQAVKLVLAFELQQMLKNHKLTKTQLADQPKLTRPQLNHLLDPLNPDITLNTLTQAAQALGQKLHIELR